MVIDTNIIIACLNAEQQAATALSAWKREGRPLFVSSITYAEVLSLPSLTEAKTAIIKAFFHNFIIVPVDMIIAERAAELRRRHRLEIPDAMIVATAAMLSVPLVTRVKFFLRGARDRIGRDYLEIQR